MRPLLVTAITALITVTAGNAPLPVTGCGGVWGDTHNTRARVTERDSPRHTPRATLQSRMKQPTSKPRVPNRGSWPKGKSGNPNGRPRTGLAFAERGRAKLDPDEAIDLALSIARDDKVEPERRLAALWGVVDRSYVKPPTTSNVNVNEHDDEPDMSGWSDEAIAKAMALREEYDALAAANSGGAGDPRLPEPTVTDDDAAGDTTLGTPTPATPRNPEAA